MDKIDNKPPPYVGGFQKMPIRKKFKRIFLSIKINPLEWILLPVFSKSDLRESPFMCGAWDTSIIMYRFYFLFLELQYSLKYKLIY